MPTHLGHSGLHLTPGTTGSTAPLYEFSGVWLQKEATKKHHSQINPQAILPICPLPPDTLTLTHRTGVSTHIYQTMPQRPYFSSPYSTAANSKRALQNTTPIPGGAQGWMGQEATWLTGGGPPMERDWNWMGLKIPSNPTMMQFVISVPCKPALPLLTALRRALFAALPANSPPRDIPQGTHPCRCHQSFPQTHIPAHPSALATATRVRPLLQVAGPARHSAKSHFTSLLSFFFLLFFPFFLSFFFPFPPGMRPFPPH